MKFKFLYIIASVLLVVSCQTRDENEKVLSVSIDPQKYLLESIVGDKYKVNSLIPAGSNPETFDPTPSQMVALGKSIIFFKVGQLNFEHVWENNMRQNTPDMLIVDCSEGVNLVDAECVDHVHHEHESGHDGADPHIWSSPRTAAIIARNMYNAVVALDSINTDYYTVNYNRLINKIDSVDTVIRNTIDRSDSKAFIIYHPALSYFAKEYGLEQHTIELNGKNPTPAQLKQLVDRANKHHIKIVFIQAEYDAKNAETLANEIGAKIVPINLLSYNWDEEMIKIANALAE